MRNIDPKFDWRTEIEKQRDAYFAELATPGMTMDELIRVNSEVLRKFPVTQEERRKKTESLMAMPEFVL